MIDVEIRLAGASDIEQLHLIEAEARSGLDGVRGGLRWLAEHPLIEWASDERSVIVALIDEVIVGYLVVDDSPPVAVVDQVFVLDGARGIGIGDALLAEAVRRARDHGADYLEATALPGDRETKNLYERAGIVARAITVSARLN